MGAIVYYVDLPVKGLDCAAERADPRDYEMPPSCATWGTDALVRPKAIFAAPITSPKAAQTFCFASSNGHSQAHADATAYSS